MTEFDYSQCTLPQLRDITARIDREQFPQRHAAALREIERREAADDGIATRAIPPKRARDIRDYVTIALAFAGGALIGMMICASASSHYNETDIPSAAEKIAMAIGFVGGGIACALWRLRSIENN